MHVDEPRQHPETGAVDLLDRILRPRFRLDEDLRKPDATHLADAVPLNDDVDRPDRRRAGAVDLRHPADDDARPRPLPFARLAVRSKGRRSGERGGGNGEEKEEQQLAHRAILHSESGRPRLLPVGVSPGGGDERTRNCCAKNGDVSARGFKFNPAVGGTHRRARRHGGSSRDGRSPSRHLRPPRRIIFS